MTNRSDLALQSGAMMEEDECPGADISLQPLLLLCKNCDRLLADTCSFVGALSKRVTGSSEFVCVGGELALLNIVDRW